MSTRSSISFITLSSTLAITLGLSACLIVDGSDDDDDSGFGNFDETGIGDGDGDSGPDPSTSGDPGTSGDGDGDSDPSTSGDGDPDPSTTGDGDGDPDPSTTGDGDGDPGPMPDPNPNVPPPPNNAYCQPTVGWNPQWETWELEVLELVNQARAIGGNCGSEGSFPASGALTLQGSLMCAARVHSKDMADNDYFDHTNQQGNGPAWRMGQAGYNGNGWGENIAAGYGSPQAVVDGWLDSDGHCANMLNPNFSKIGIGYAYANNSEWGNYWTQNFGN